MHDCILDITWDTTKLNCSKKELKEIFKQLPSELKHEAYECGMSDTLWRDKFGAWYIDNAEYLPGTIWNEENINKVKEFINKELCTLTPEELRERKIFIELLAEKYRAEDKNNKKNDQKY